MTTRSVRIVCDEKLSEVGLQLVAFSTALGLSAAEPIVFFSDRPPEVRELVRVDQLIFLSSSSTEEVLRFWIGHVNAAVCNILLTGNEVGDLFRASVTATSEIAMSTDGLQALVAESAEKASHGKKQRTRLIELRSDVVGRYVATDIEGMCAQITDDSIRILGVSPTLVRKLTREKARTWGEYYLSRVLRSSRERVESEYVRIRVELTGTDSSTSPSIMRSSLAQVLTDSRSSDLIVLRGAPGSGKSFQLRYFDYESALDSLESSADDESRLLTFCVNLGEHAAEGKESDPLEWLEGRWERRIDISQTEIGRLSNCMKSFSVRLLLDGLNEIPFSDSEERREWMNKWKYCIHEDLLKYRNVKVVVACRSRDLLIGLSTSETSCTYVDMMPLLEKEILEMSRRSDFTAHQKLEKAFESDKTLVNLYQNPFALTDFLRTHASEVPRTQSEIFWRRIVAALKRDRQEHKNAVAFQSDWLPDRPVQNLVHATTVREAAPLMKTIPLLSALGGLAQNMTKIRREHGLVRTSVDMEECLEEFGHVDIAPSGSDASDALYLAQDYTLLEVSEGWVRFTHQSLQDFFAALALSPDDIVEEVAIPNKRFTEKLGEISEALKSLAFGDTLQVLPSTGYEEVFSRLIEIRGEVWEDVVYTNPWLVSESSSKIASLRENNHLQSSLISSLKSRIKESGEARERIASLTSLGELRHNPFDKEGGASFPVTLIPSRTWALGVTKKNSAIFGNPQPWHRRRIEEFKIGSFPVTNMEFAVFMGAEGYLKKQYWSDEGWSWRSGQLPVEPVVERWLGRRDRVAKDADKPLRLLREGKVSIVEAAAIIRFSNMTDGEVRQVANALVGEVICCPAFWHDDRYNNPLQPVVGVSFYEASAYCVWRAECSGLDWRLPTEDEWEAAALASRAAFSEADILSVDRLPVPNVWCHSWGNTAELHVGKPTPVGVFSGNDELFSSVSADMSGNVFEWVDEVYREGEEWCKVVKGGSFRHLLRRAHPGYRGRGDNTSRNDDNGFRVTVST